MTVRTHFVNIFEGPDGSLYPSGILHKTEQKAMDARTNKNLKGKVLYLAQVIWDDAKSEKS